MSDIPPPPPGFTVEEDKPNRRKRGQRKADAIAPPSVDGDIIVRPIDGDTLKLTSGRDLRLWGVDAPESRQQGWDRQGNVIAIGREATGTLRDLIGSGQPTLGNSVGTSYGRLVAPVTVNDMDAGLSMIRDGPALSAPSYLSADPSRRYDYSQAERLARQNFRGMHRTYNQRPEQFRHSPDYQPSRDDLAQFWDTPTPNAGLTADVEQGYLDVATHGSPKDIMAYADAHGFKVNPGEVAKFVANRNKGVGVERQVYYRDAPKPLTDPGDGMTGAAMRGVGNGVLPNFLEETGAVVDAAGLTPGRENVWNSERRLADIWKNNYDQNAAITGHDEAFHPYASGAGEIAGGFVVPMARVRSAADLAKWGAGFGFVSGLGQDGSIPERLTSGVVGAGEGAATTTLGTRALEAVTPHVQRWMGTKGVKDAQGAVGVAEGHSDDIPSPPDGFTIDGSQMRAERFDGPVTGGAAEPHSGGFQSESLQASDSTPDGVPLPPQGFTLDRPIAMQSESGASISQDLRQPDYLFTDRPTRMDQPLTEAQMRAASENILPGDVLPIASNEVGSIEEAAAKDAGRYVEAKPVDEATALESRTVTAQNGRELPKRGPLDLVTWLRSQGGVKDQGGNLRAMGIDNAPRDLDFARGEERFGRLISDEGMSLDDAAMRAWETGYLPGQDRPDINTLLDAIDRTHSGAERYYHPNDLPAVEQFHGMRADRQALEEQLAQGPVYNDRSVAAGEDRPLPPIHAYEEWPAGGAGLRRQYPSQQAREPSGHRASDVVHRKACRFRRCDTEPGDARRNRPIGFRARYDT